MGNIKVGDMVRVLRKTTGHQFKIGSVVQMAGYEGDGIHLFEDFTGVTWFMDPEEYEYLCGKNTIQLNNQYTSKNGNKWECIAVRGDTAWLAGIFDGVADGAAYMYKLDGSAVCLASRSDKYDIKWEPVVEWVEDALGYDTNDRQIYSTLGDVKINVRFPLIDGEPDFTQATITRA